MDLEEPHDWNLRLPEDLIEYIERGSAQAPCSRTVFMASC
jgi:hypothetical protein